jgi:hypothetical protein
MGTKEEINEMFDALERVTPQTEPPVEEEPADKPPATEAPKTDDEPAPATDAPKGDEDDSPKTSSTATYEPADTSPVDALKREI